ncbi:MAG TPA: LanC-like protein [Polyangiaceae bacterium]|nr:LanC-like protein [Polyangiaceae bacterium]
MLYDPARHEPLRLLPWDESQVRAAIEHIVSETESRFSEDEYWPLHPLDREGDEMGRVETPLYHGACGVFWALHYLQAVGAATLSRSYVGEWDRLLARNRTWLGKSVERDRASFVVGDTPIRMMAFGGEPTEELESALDALIAGNLEHPARDLMSGSPGTLLAALFLYERTGKPRWSDLFRLTADKLWSQLEWSPRHRCSYWTQDLDGRLSNCLGAVHGFVGAALPLIRGRYLLDAEAWTAWERCIVTTAQRTAHRLGAHANWRPQLDITNDVKKKLVQFCHGAPGFVICLAGIPSTALDDLLLAAGETIWSAGPLTKGSNLCHGTGGNGYAFLKLHQRTRDFRWLERARSFAMHGIAQTREDALRYGQSRYSLWSGDLGFAIYLWDCLRAEAQFPTLDVFYASHGSAAWMREREGDPR